MAALTEEETMANRTRVKTNPIPSPILKKHTAYGSVRIAEQVRNKNKTHPLHLRECSNGWLVKAGKAQFVNALN
jgi:hypothetical protein